MAREAVAAYRSRGDAADDRPEVPLTDAVEGLADAWDRVTSVDVQVCDEPSIRAAMAALQRHGRAVQAHVTKLAGQLDKRQRYRLNPEHPDDPRTRQQAEEDLRRELGGKLRMTPSEAKDTMVAAQGLEKLPAAAQRAFSDGAITPKHARKLSETLEQFGDDAERDTVEAKLLRAAKGQNARDFGRTCRRLLARHDTEAAQRDLDRLKDRRYARYTQDADGMVHIHAGYAGIEAEYVMTAFEVFRSKDTPGEHRTTAQRSADALFEALKHALEHKDTTQHGNRPHILVEVRWQDLVNDTGVADTTFTGPLPVSEIRRLLDDASISRVITGPDSQVLDVGRATRSLPGPAWRAMLKRDGGCTLDGCDAPPARCQGAHMDRRWLQGAGTSVAEQAMACWRCHRTIDRLNLIGKVIHDQVVWFRPDGTRFRRGGDGRIHRR